MKKITQWVLSAFLCSASLASMAQVQTLNVRIANSTDDAEERGLNATSGIGTIDLTSSDIELANDGGDGGQFIGLRFENITIPQGAIITNAYIQFTVDETDNANGSIVFKVEDVDSSTTFTSTPFDISSRTTAMDSVVWSNIPAWNTVGVAGPDQATPDISTLIQYLVNKSGWKSGNALNIIATGTGERTAEAYDGTSSSAAELVVEYVTPIMASFSIATGDDDAEEDVSNGSMDLTSSDVELTTDGSFIQIVGLRYTNVNIPKGSTILSAHVQFTVDEVTTTGNVDVLIGAEASGNAAPITSASGNLSSRTFDLGDTTIWNVNAWPTVGVAGADQLSPDIAVAIQNVVDNANWVSGNAMLIAMVDPAVLGAPGYTGNTGKRTAESYNGSASSAPKLIVNYVAPATYQNGVFPVAKGSSWKYNDDGVDLSSSAWTTLNYNDSTWAFGDAILGYNNGNETTTLDFGADANNKYPTYYLRNTFHVADKSQYDSLVFNLLRDDGAVVYLNGVEVFRQNMPSGAISYNTLATSTVGGADETKYFTTKTANILQNGLNVVAVELHQASASSSDLSFDLEVGYTLPALQAANYPLTKGSDWAYLDNGISLDAISWKDTSYNDYSWGQGKAPLGYGDPMATTISYGADAANKIITYYFRRSLMVDLNQVGDTVVFGLRRDDGAVVYLNGVELFRSNMPSGIVDYLTHSSTIVSGGDETVYYTYNFPKSVFRNGKNQIAVEIHNRDQTSSDLGFDLYIEDLPVPNPPALGCANGNGNHIACFTSIAPTSQTNNMIIPDGTHRFQMILKQGSAYSIGSGNIPGNHDFTGYIPMNGDSELGHLSVNHENSPGGVTIADIHYDDSLKLWVVDSSQAVDFYNNDIVTTARNCSGGITPWGTVITSEESTNSGDVNNDGYEDVGWQVEIDPVTAKVVDYDNDGVQDKLWALGRMSHENIVVANDSITAYYGEDGGTHCVYKFVADNKADLSTGTLYVLKLDQPMVGGDPTGTTATWVQVPNTTQSDRNNARNLAASLGGTNFSGVEDCEISPVDGKIYFIAKGQNRVYRFSDNGSTVSNFETFVGGTSYILNTSGGVFTEAWGSGNDNLTFDNEGNLWVLQDGGRNYIWVVRPDHTQASPKVELFASMPSGSEPTGLTFTPDYRFGFFSVQHPSSSNAPQLDATGNNITFDASATVVFSREKWLGAQAPVAGFEADTTVVEEGGSVVYTDTSSNNPTVREWIFSGGLPTLSSNKVETVTYGLKGFYTTELRVANAAGSDTATYVQYIEVVEKIGLDENTFKESLEVYPNPTNGIITIEFETLGGEDISIDLYDLSGKKIANLVNEISLGGKQSWEVDLSDKVSATQALLVKVTADSKTADYIVHYKR